MMSMMSMMGDVLLAFRALRRTPSLTATAGITLALGIGVNTAIFGIVDGMLFRPLPLHEPDRLVLMQGYVRETGQVFTNVPQMIFVDAETRHKGLNGLALIDLPTSLTRPLDLGAESWRGAPVTTNLLDVVGVRPVAGRGFVAGEDVPGRNDVIVIAHGIWLDRFGGDPNVIGRMIPFERRTLQVIGVLPPAFVLPSGFGQRVDFLVPMEVDRTDRANLTGGVFTPLARLAPGVSIQQAQTELDELAANANSRLDEKRRANVRLVNLQAGLFGPRRQTAFMLLATAGFVLLMACANLANLLLARGSEREREMAVRVALGAGGSRLAAQVLSEAVLLAAFGGLAAYLLAYWTFGGVVSQLPPGVAVLVPPHLDLRAFGFTLAIAAAAAVVFALGPALRVWRTDVRALMQSGARSGRRERTYGRAALVAGELALGVVLLAGAGLMINSLARMRAVDLGFVKNDLYTLNVGLPASRYPTGVHHLAFHEELMARLRDTPGVRAVGAANSLPMGSSAPMYALMAQGRGAGERGGVWETTADYFSTMGMLVVEGRTYSVREARDRVPVAVVNQSAARRLWPGTSAIGQRHTIVGRPESFEIVGVVGDVRYRFDVPEMPSMYIPFKADRRAVTIVVRADPAVEGVGAAMATQTLSLDRRLVRPRVQRVVDVIAASLATRQFQVEVLGLFALLALALCAVGIYGVVGYAVSRRTFEIGVRMALGAGRSDVRRMVIRDAFRPVMFGLAVGVAVALMLTRVLRAELFEIQPHDPATFALVLLTLTIVAFVAAYVPARRASQVDPLVALRTE